MMILAVAIIILVLAIVGGVIWYIYMKFRYKTVPSNEALIITGPNLGDPKKESNIHHDSEGRSIKVVRGGGERLKLFQSFTRVSLSSFQLKIKTPKVYTKHGVGIFGEAVATVKVADTLEGIVKYAEQFLGKKQSEIEGEISEVLGSNLRAILSEMSVEEINSDRQVFNERVRKIAQKELDEMGFKITSLGLTNIADDEGYLENLGRPQISDVKKQAEIAESTNERETRVHVAKMDEEVAREEYARKMNIADSRKEKEIKDQRILAETQREKAISEAAYELEQEERRLEIERKRLEIKQQDKERELMLQKLERENQVLLEEEEVKVRRQKADALFYEKLKEAEATAEARIRDGKAEAEVIQAKSKAEIEAIEKRAEALNKHQDVILREKIIEMMPEFAKAVSDSMSNVDSIRILDSGSGKQINSLPKSVTSNMVALQESLKEMTGIDLTNIINSVSGVDQKTDEVNDDPLEEIDDELEITTDDIHTPTVEELDQPSDNLHVVENENENENESNNENE
ncbi:flotillin family protein [Pseudogracilibacillus auburnensis]|uniref:Flotillin n=1 Tax=Pseudogracilibacillus auburnensis TaxID=1494959 RepID=A0A2V3VKN7_9BACI|nr:SPFH domain-containing protein [Pseudogracilibacillus auburnensis]PXW82353.1 flotillin [Pseudogracilibacillus auburnensis]